MTTEEKRMPSIKPYGVAIQQAMASGDLAQMKAAAEQAEYILDNVDDIRDALTTLRQHIDKNE